MRRKAMQDFVFTNGLVVPQGVTVCVSSGSMQTDDVSFTSEVSETYI
jgi:cytochrome P450